MKKNFARDLTVGAVVLLAAFIFTIGIFSIGSEQKIWVKKVAYRIKVPDANGLQSGSPVRLAGVQVGTVTGVSFPEDPNQMGVEVGLAVDRAHQHRIRQDTVANVKILTLLGGEKYIELTPGSPSQAALPPGSYLTVPASFGIEQLGELSASLADDIKSISGNVRIVLETVQKQEGVVGRMLLDPNFGQQTFSDIAESARLTREALEDVNEGRGLVGKALTDEQFANETTASIRNSLTRIEALVEKLTDERGIVYQALDPNGRVAVAVDNFEKATADLQDFTAELKAGRGTLGRLVSDEEYGKELLENLKKISSNLAAITDRLNKGDGSLGRLINDPQLYEDIRSVVRGVQDSKVMSGLIRHYREKGEKALRKKEREKSAADPNAPEGGS